MESATSSYKWLRLNKMFSEIVRLFQNMLNKVSLVNYHSSEVQVLHLFPNQEPDTLLHRYNAAHELVLRLVVFLLLVGS